MHNSKLATGEFGPSKTVCVTTLPYKILITTLPMFVHVYLPLNSKYDRLTFLAHPAYFVCAFTYFSFILGLVLRYFGRYPAMGSARYRNVQRKTNGQFNTDAAYRGHTFLVRSL